MKVIGKYDGSTPRSKVSIGAAILTDIKLDSSGIELYDVMFKFIAEA